MRAPSLVLTLLALPALAAPSDGGIGTTDRPGLPVVDVALPGGSLHVTVLDGAGRRLAGATVTLARSSSDNPEGIVEEKATTDGEGLARFSGLGTAPDMGYALRVESDRLRASSAPFALGGEHGWRLLMRVEPPLRDTARLRIGGRSHLVLTPREGGVQVVENLIIENPDERAVDPGPDGLRLPLPAGATEADVAEELPGLRIEQGAATLRAVLPPGPTEIRFGFVLPIRDGEAILRQPTPLPFASTVLVTERRPGMEIEGEGLSRNEQGVAGGRSIWVVSGPGTKAGGELRAKVTGLPRTSSLDRIVAGIVALVILLVGLVAAIRVPARRREERTDLERRRSELLDRIADHDDGRGGEASREAMVAELEQVYRKIDGLDESPT